MNAARPSDGLLPASATIRLIELLAARSRPTESEHLLRDLAAIESISWSRARNTIIKLISYGVILPVGGTAVAIASAEGYWRLAIARMVAADLINVLNSANAWRCLRLDIETSAITIDAMVLPPMLDGLGMWIIDFGVAERNRTEARHWVVAIHHRSKLLSGAIDANKRPPRRAISAERLAAQLERQAEAGATAERWVVEFERKRLCEHPLNEQVRRVSVDDVAAGYDVVSFVSPSSLQHDLFIEVKSYGATKRFHWSRNEIATAYEFGEAYALYLVDRTRFADKEYVPHIITGPSPEMFALPESGWKVEATSYEHVALSDHRSK